MVRAALVGFLLSSLLSPVPAHARPAQRTFQHEHFTLPLPAGWFVADVRPGPPGSRYAPTKRPRAAASARVVHFSDGRGNYLSVYVDHAADFEADVVWTVHPSRDGDAVEVGAETPCDRSRGACPAGNGTLEIGTLPPLPLRGHRFTFVFGNVRKEQGVNLDTFRWLLQEFRAR
jgi:hypothetical protein